MEKVNALKETLAIFIESVEKVKDIDNSADLSEIERKAVRALQLAEVQIAEAGDDLYCAVRDQRRAINEGRVVKKEEVKVGTGVDTKAKASKPRRAKRQTKKSSK